jgi:hypothetical protein
LLRASIGASDASNERDFRLKQSSAEDFQRLR